MSPSLEYSGTVWAFAPLSGLVLLHPDGSIGSIHDHFALMMFGYNQDELLQKVSQCDQWNGGMWNDNCDDAYFCHCCFIDRALRFWCLVSMDGLLTQLRRPTPSLILKLCPRYQRNQVSVCVRSTCWDPLVLFNLTSSFQTKLKQVKERHRNCINWKVDVNYQKTLNYNPQILASLSFSVSFYCTFCLVF